MKGYDKRTRARNFAALQHCWRAREDTIFSLGRLFITGTYKCCLQQLWLWAIQWGIEDALAEKFSPSPESSFCTYAVLLCTSVVSRRQQKVKNYGLVLLLFLSCISSRRFVARFSESVQQFIAKVHPTSWHNIIVYLVSFPFSLFLLLLLLLCPLRLWLLPRCVN